MNTEQAILETIRTLPQDKQQEVLDFAEFLKQKTEGKDQLKRFKQLVENWRAEQDPFSSVINFDHPAYKAIIGMGMDAVPLILRELQEDPDYWFWALQQITKENPVEAGQEGNLELMTLVWLSWGEERGYISK